MLNVYRIECEGVLERWNPRNAMATFPAFCSSNVDQWIFLVL
jgi:hypothetical protein